MSNPQYKKALRGIDNTDDPMLLTELRDKINEKLQLPSRDGLHNQIEDLKRQITDLQDCLEDAEIVTAGLSGAGVGGLEAARNKAQEQREKHRDEISKRDRQIQAYIDLLAKHPPNFISHPHLVQLQQSGAHLPYKLPVLPSFITEERPDNKMRNQIEEKNPSVLMFLPEEVTGVGITIDVMTGLGETEQIYNGTDFYPGTVKHIRETLVPYCKSLMRLSPLPEDLTRRGALDVSDITLLSH